MDSTLAHQVWLRARSCCEYCQMPQHGDDSPFEIDHIIARKHGGPTSARNLALSCFWCNSFKGSDLSGLTPRTRRLTPLFNPRRHKWSHHFRWNGPVLHGLTAIGQVTVTLLRINAPFRVELRARLIAEGRFTPIL
jgi:hypothetical protein